MSTLHIRLPSRSVADNAAHWIALSCPYALMGGGGSIEREGHAALSDLAGLIGGAQRVVLLLAASDVTLLHLKVPPMSAARLRLALPNMVEDQLMSDPAECVMVAGGSVGELRTVAVMQRAWLQILLQTVRGFGARHVLALPSQLCLALPADGVAVAVTAFGAEQDITLRMAAHDGLGLPVLPDDPALASHDVVQTICALAPLASIALYVPQEQVTVYQQTVEQLLPLEPRIAVFADSPMRWSADARAIGLNLVAGLGGGAGSSAVEWRRWRWPIALGTLLLLLNIGALNFEWWRLSREAVRLRASMVQIYRSAYPKETVIVDPAAQMRQKIAAAQRDSGMAGPDDFGPLAASFAAAWSTLGAADGTGKPVIASLEYRERSLFVKPKAAPSVPLARVKAALSARNLSLTQPAPGVWQIRSAR